VDIEQPRYSTSRPHAEGRPDRGKKYLLNAMLEEPYAHAEIRRRTSPQASRKDAINAGFANRTRVRAKTRVGMIRKHSRQEIKKAS